jgi:hypothetical protein
MDEIPDELIEILTDEELENLQSRTGWAIGTIQLIEDRENEDGEDENRVVKRELSDCPIELLNGRGTAGRFGGMNAFAVDTDGKFMEVKAYGSIDAFDVSSKSSGWVVTEYTDPADPPISNEK